MKINLHFFLEGVRSFQFFVLVAQTSTYFYLNVHFVQPIKLNKAFAVTESLCSFAGVPASRGNTELDISLLYCANDVFPPQFNHFFPQFPNISNVSQTPPNFHVELPCISSLEPCHGSCGAYTNSTWSLHMKI
jgi:hypothetical protein